MEFVFKTTDSSGQEHNWTSKHLPFAIGSKMFVKLIDLGVESVGSAVSEYIKFLQGDPSADISNPATEVRKFARNLLASGDDTVEKIVFTLLSSSKRDGNSISMTGVAVSTPNIITLDVFSGNYGELVEALAVVIEENYKSFFTTLKRKQPNLSGAAKSVAETFAIANPEDLEKLQRAILASI